MKSIVCILLLALISCDNLLKFQVHLENQKRNITDNLNDVKLNLTSTFSSNANQTCIDHPLCANSYCKNVKKVRTVPYKEERTWGLFESGKPAVRNDRNGWVCSHDLVRLGAICYGNKWWRMRTKTESFTERDSRCTRLIDESFQLLSIDSIEMELDDVENQCEEVTNNNTQLISC